MEAGHRSRTINTINTRGVANRRATRRRRATTSAVALFTILMAGSGIANAQTVIWEATLTVEAFANVTGYSSTRQQGSLTNTTFKYKGRTLTVNAVATSELEGTTELILGINDLFSEEPELSNWTLTIAGTDYTEATADPDRAENQLSWTTYPTWSDGDMVTVRLTTTEPGAPRNIKVYSDCEITPPSSSAPALTGGCHG